LLFPDRHLTGLLLWAALISLLMGILGAVAQSEMKRLLSFTLVSHIGYMILGIGLATRAGYSGAIFYVVHHITIQTALFLVLGLVERRAGSTSLIKLGGLARFAPLLGVLFFVPAMNLAGIPPLSGFLGKVALTEAGLRVGTPLAIAVVAAGILTSLLTLYAIAKSWNLAFWRTPAQAHEMAEQLSVAARSAGAAVRSRGPVHVGAGVFGAPDLDEAASIIDENDQTNKDFHQLLGEESLPSRLPRTMVGATAGLVAVSLGITVVAGPLFGYTDRTAHDILNRGVYISSVLPDGSR
jgi:multicomponent Na+:H+ antiporter subunit D